MSQGRNCSPLLQINDTLDMLSEAKWFPTLNLKSSYCQVDLHPDDKEKTAFSTGQGLWQFTVVPFGLCNAPVTFERLMETVLRGLTFDSCPVYLDEMIMIGRTFEEHLLNLRKVFEWFREACVKLNPEKRQLFQKEVQYFGHIVSPEGITTDPGKQKAARECLTPKNKHKIRSFLGLCTYYRLFKFCQHCGTADETYGGEARLSLDSRSGGCLPNTKSGPL
jgi:hypothetical protein